MTQITLFEKIFIHFLHTIVWKNLMQEHLNTIKNKSITSGNTKQQVLI